MRAAVFLFVAGCAANSDPCAGKSGVCIGLHIVGNVSGLEQLVLGIDAPGTTPQRRPDPPMSFSLPVKVALFPPAGTTGTVHINCDGLGDQQQLLAHGETDAVLVGGHAQATLTLTATSADLSAPDLSGADFAGADFSGVDFAGADLAGCADVTACMDGDGCCPSGCNNSNDHDCTPVCGNGVTETGEVCDDGNAVNGDGCDPTCRWAGVVTTLSGTPGDCSYADGVAARFTPFSSIASDGTKVWVNDSSATIREVYLDFSAPQTYPAKTIIGVPYDARLVDGPFATARLQGLGNTGTYRSIPLVYVSSAQKLYAADDNGTNYVLREIDLTNHTITTIASSVVANSPIALATDGTTIFYLGKSGDVNKWKPGDAMSTQIYAGPTSCTAIARSQGATFLGCSGGIMQVTDAGVATTYAGNLGTSGCSDNANKTMATFQVVTGIQANSSGDLFVSDCNAIREVASAGGVTTIAGKLGTIGYADGTAGTVLFGLNAMPFVFFDNSLAWGTNVGFVGDNCVVRRFDTAGDVTTMWGQTGAAHVPDTRGSGAASRYSSLVPPFSFHSGLVSDGNKLYSLGRSDGTMVIGYPRTVIAIDIASGTSVDLFTFGADARAVTRIANTLYVALADGTIHSIQTDGTGDAVLAGMGGNSTYPPSNGTPGNLRSAVLNPNAITTDGTDLYFVDAAKLVRKITLASSTVSLVAGTQDSTDIVDGAGGSAHFANPMDLTFARGNLYVLDGMTFTKPGAVRRISLSSRQVDMIAGQINNTGDADGVGLAGQIAGAWSLASDGDSLFISDAVEPNLTDASLSPSIRQLDLGSLSLTTLVGTRGQWTTLNGVGVKALVNAPGAITFDATTHALYFFDRHEGVYRKIR